MMKEVTTISTADCVFCKIIRKEIPSDVVYEDDRVLAFKDIQPQAPIHILIIPKEHFASMNEVDAARTEIMGYLMTIIPKIAVEQGISESGYRVITNTGKESGQIVPHLHFHILGGRQLRSLG